MEMQIERDALVEASDGAIGRVKHVIVDRETREVTDLVVEHDRDEWLIPISAVVSAERGRIRLRGRRADLQDAGVFERQRYHAVDDEQAITESQGHARRGGAPLEDASADAVVIRDVGQTPPASVPPSFRYMQREAPPTPERQARQASTERPSVELREEELRARKEMVETGRVEVHKDVVTEQRTVEVPVTREEVVVERHPVDPRPADRPTAEGETIRVPVREEEVTVEKRPVVTEEIRIGKRPVEETEQVSGTVRREEARIEREGDVSLEGTDAERARTRREPE